MKCAISDIKPLYYEVTKKNSKSKTIIIIGKVLSNLLAEWGLIDNG